jgi:hypothetical protein
MIRYLNKSRTIKNCPIPSFKGILTAARGSMIEAIRLQAGSSVPGKTIGFFSLCKTFQLQSGPGVDSLGQIRSTTNLPGAKRVSSM